MGFIDRVFTKKNDKFLLKESHKDIDFMEGRISDRLDTYMKNTKERYRAMEYHNLDYFDLLDDYQDALDENATRYVLREISGVTYNLIKFFIKVKYKFLFLIWYIVKPD